VCPTGRSRQTGTHVPQEVREPACIRSDYRNLGCHTFERHNAERLIKTGEASDIGDLVNPQEVGVAYVSEKVDAVADTQMVCLSLELIEVVSSANQQETSVRLLVKYALRRVQKHLNALCSHHPADKEHNAFMAGGVLIAQCLPIELEIKGIGVRAVRDHDNLVGRQREQVPELCVHVVAIDYDFPR